MKVVILGGGGFLGANLACSLLQRGHSVRVFDLPRVSVDADLNLPQIERLGGDFCNKDDVEDAIDGCDVAYHLVSTTLPKTSNQNPVYDIESNVAGTLRLLDAAVRKGTRKVVFASSGGTVYGIPKSLPIHEEHPTDPICSYGICKLAIEKYLFLYNTLYGLDYTILRLANPYGDRQRTTASQGAVAVFLSKALSGEEIQIWGDGSVTRDYVYVSDVTEAFLLAGTCFGLSEKIYNIGSGEGHSLTDLVNTISAVIGRKPQYKHLPSRSFDVPSNILDIGRACGILGWKPRVSFFDGIAATLQWILTHS